MSDLHSEIDAAESLMAELADEYVERLERGERPDIDEYVMRWPGDPLVLRQALASLKLVRLSSLKEAGEGAVEAADAAGRLGDFQLLREIGRGGMGVVYEAEQHSLGRRVALKLLPLAGMLDPRQLQRFKNEALAAAQLNHPNIVDVIAVGCERGVHYYAMRLIDGLTLAEVITALKRSGRSESVDGSRRLHEERPAGTEGGGTKSADAVEELQTEQPDAGSRAYRSPHAPREEDHHAERDTYGTRDVLEPAADAESTAPLAHLSTDRPGEYYRSVARLLADAADALDYAHQSGVVHRDVKPSNLMLDSRGKVWVTDFGLARVESNTEMTMTGDLLGTLRYMSPEQASGNRRLLDHRTDVYSLGATLYELLTLRPAFNGSDRQQLLLQIAEAEPLAPRKIARFVPADLETITLKAMEKEPTQRYVTAAALAGDLRRFLEGKAIQARRAGPLERVARWSRRHRGLIGATTAVLVIAVIVLTVSNYRIGVALDTANSATIAATNSAEAEKQMRIKATDAAEAEKAARLAEGAERQQREIVANFFMQAFQRADPLADGRELKVVDVLDDAVAKLEGDHGLAPTIKADILHTFGQTYLGLGLPEKAVNVNERLVILRRDELGPDHPATLASMHNLAFAYNDAGRFDDAIPLLEQTLAKRTAKGADDAGVAENMSNLGRAYFNAGQSEKAIPVLVAALARMKKTPGPDSPVTLITEYHLAMAFRNTGRLSEASSLTEELANGSKKLAPDHPVAGLAALLLASAYQDRGENEKAIPLLERSVESARRAVGPDHIDTLGAINNLGDAYKKSGRFDDAAHLLENALANARKTLGSDHPNTLTIVNNLASVYNEADRFDAAVPLLEEALAARTRRRELEHPSTLKAVNNLAVAYRGVGKLAEAIPLFEQSLTGKGKILGPDHPDTLSTMRNLAVVYMESRQLDRCLPLFEEALTGLSDKLGPDDPLTISTVENLAYVYHEVGRFDEAIRLFEQALAHRESELGAGHPDTLQNMHNLAGAYARAKCFDDALALRERHLATTKKTLGPDDPNTLLSMNLLGVLYWQTGKLAQSIPIFEEQLQALKRIRGGEHHETLNAMANLAVNYRDAGRLPEAIVLFEQTLDSLRKHPESAADLLTWVPRDLALAYDLAGELAKSEPFYREFLVQARKARGNDDLDTAATMAQLATNLLFQRKFADAEPILRECLEVREAKIADDWATFNARSLLGGSLLGQKKYAEAEPFLVAGYEGMRERADQIPPQGKVRLHEALERLLQFYDEWGKPDEAAKWRATDPLSPARLLGMRGRFRAAAEIHRQLFESQPELTRDPTKPNRYSGACLAALAAAGEGTDAADLTSDERAKWRRQALDWLRADLDAWKQRLASDAGSRALMLEALSKWQQDPDFRSVRDDQALAALAGEEQSAWRELWREVAELVGSLSSSVP